MFDSFIKLFWRGPIVFSAICVGFLSVAFIDIQVNQTITLKDSNFNFIPSKFYISDVADGRVNRSYTAMLVEKGKSRPQQIDLKGGQIHSIKVFLDHNLHRDTLLKPVLLIIKDFNLIETKMSNGAVHGDLKINFSYSSQLSYENKHLVDFTEEISYNRDIDEASVVEPCLRRGIVNGLKYFNNWSNTANK